MDFLNRIIKEVIEERSRIDEEFRGNNFYVYHVARQEALPSLFKFGFEAFYTASKIGNAYGRGVYSTFDLDSSIKNAQRGEYGRVILRCKVRSLHNFLIWSSEIAKAVYGGHWRVSSQLDLLCPRHMLEKMKTLVVGSHFWSKSSGDVYTQISSYNDYTSQNAHAAVWCGEKYKAFDELYNGLIFTGPHDGNVCVVRDFKNVFPVEYSLDFGKTWKKVEADIKFKDYVLNDIDLKYEVGTLYDEVPFHFDNDFARVRNGGKYNYLYKSTYKNGVISPIWFDDGALTFTSKGDCLVVYNETNYILHHKRDTDEFFVLDNEKNFLCYLSDFESFISNSGVDDDW